MTNALIEIYHPDYSSVIVHYLSKIYKISDTLFKSLDFNPGSSTHMHSFAWDPHYVIKFCIPFGDDDMSIKPSVYMYDGVSRAAISFCFT